MTPCPDENVIARFVRGGLSAAEARGVELHVDRCSACSTLISALAQMGSTGPAPGAQTASAPGAQMASAGLAATTGPAPGARTASTGLAITTGPAPALATGAAPELVFGRYSVERPIGAGAMGVVYAAVDPVLGRRVALKVLRRERASSPAHAAHADERLLREARLMAALAHPNVVPIHDAGVVGDQVFLAMELVEGRTLADWLRAGPGSYREVLARFRDAALGLAAAHDAGILHRDFKPANVLIGADGRARVTDFGLARPDALLAAGPGWPGTADMTATTAGALVGTPAYMAPEQMFHRAVDARADQFSFCVALYEALFGAQPFGGGNIAERRYCLANHEPAWPADTRGVPRALTAAVVRGLSPSPDGRFLSMRALVDALDDSLSRSGELHVRINAVCQAIAGAVHVALLASFIASDPLGSAARPPAPTGSGAAVATSLGDTIIGAVASGMFLGLLLFFVMTPIGIVWAPLNAIGLARRWSWARRSTMAYGALCLFSCVALPYGIYALWSLRRPGVREAFTRR